ncbi:FAD/NAD(P)-binding protein [uncultured Nonlabens sp.]|uniref:FAD/NAD(P)-binding protein n=1 Tax=uncultured Nonlabens sp. TaxID=859306 RepID=UPI00262E0A12|nr:FAD/NAD(P)-binding protein [uncultured Nonlabens sp.]
MKRIAIIGCGPRGLHSLECLINSLSRKRDNNIHITIYDDQPELGSGQVWKTDQAKSNWLNISDRALINLKGRSETYYKSCKIPRFPSFIDWIEKYHNHALSDQIDQFPPRKIMGSYLHQRFTSIATTLINHEILEVKTEKVNELTYKNPYFIMTDAHNISHQYDECLLTIGHQPTKDDDQIKSWKEQCKKGAGKLFDNPYEYEKEVLDKVTENDKVALRGFGLAMIDLTRILTVEKGAEFKKIKDSDFLKYIPSDTSIKKIVPFSLNGLPAVPKPLGKEVDQLFTPDTAQICSFKSKIVHSLQSVGTLKDLNFLYDAFLDVAIPLHNKNASVNNSVEDKSVFSIAKKWMRDMSYKHELILDTSIGCKQYMKATAQMAMGKTTVSLDYTLGQVWRHLQPSMYELFSHCDLNDLIMGDLIKLDESTKRYSYGPPVESILQLIALEEAGVLDLNYIKNPSINSNVKGWKLNNNQQTQHINVMINTVLDTPRLVDIESGLITDLMKNDLLKPVTSDLGVFTNKDGTVQLDTQDNRIHLTMLGRNCKGSVMGVDAILECFGKRIEDWADAIVNRIA